MSKVRRPGAKNSRGAELENALFKALETKVPDKDTGPDPDDILRDLSGDDEGDGGLSQEKNSERRSQTVALDEADRRFCERIVQIVRGQTGEQIDDAQAIKVALSICPLDEEQIKAAYRDVCSREIDHE